VAAEVAAAWATVAVFSTPRLMERPKVNPHSVLNVVPMIASAPARKLNAKLAP
jgi:hypothetical protein